MRTLIYARYSSTLQNPRSCADQIEACRERARAEGWQVVECFSDAAISGAAGIAEEQRPGLAALLARLAMGGIDQVLTEGTDRIARHQGDAFMVRERIEYAGARLFTLMDGVVDDITGTIKGLFDARFRKDLGQRVKRGHAGNIAEGRSPSGVAYGYRKVSQFDEKGEAVRGLRAIDEDKAEVVRRIFAEYAGGRSPRSIAAELNADGIPAPRGGLWRPSTIIGHRNAGFGVLANPIYIGILQYGRTRAVVDPATRARRTLPGRESLVEGQAPHLRIVDQAVWDAVQRQLEERTSAAYGGAPRPERQRRARHLLSGLGKCGECGATWVVTRDDYFGCGAVMETGTCTNRRLIRKAEYEARVLAALQDLMLAPDAVAAYLDEYRAEAARAAGDAARKRARLEQKQAEAGRKVARLVKAVADGGGEFAEIRAALAEARRAQDEANRELARADAMPQVALHPGLARQYREAVENLSAELADPSTRHEAAAALRKLIARVVIRPADSPKGVEIEVIRHIDQLVDLARKKA